ncbi:MAG: hypothetical protein KDE09_11810 [Anaerolineales bacterium]|nr:hypothetical protein [Anaerolineales bacterium]
MPNSQSNVQTQLPPADTGVLPNPDGMLSSKVQIQQLKDTLLSNSAIASYSPRKPTDKEVAFVEEKIKHIQPMHEVLRDSAVTLKNWHLGLGALSAIVTSVSALATGTGWAGSELLSTSSVALITAGAAVLTSLTAFLNLEKRAGEKSLAAAALSKAEDTLRLLLLAPPTLEQLGAKLNEISETIREVEKDHPIADPWFKRLFSRKGSKHMVTNS